MPRPWLRPLAAIMALLWATAAEPATQGPDSTEAGAQRYDDCMARARTDPRAALASASAWEAAGGGAPAGHCAARALSALGRNAEAARKLETLARDARDPRVVRFRAELFAQAGNAWLAAGMAEAAERALDEALMLRPGDADARIDRGLARATAKRFKDALADFNDVLAAYPDRADVLVLRAAAHRELGALDQAEKDLDRALALEPKRPDALLELGILRARNADLNGARDAWRTLLQVSPTGPEADLARRNLARIDGAARAR